MGEITQVHKVKSIFVLTLSLLILVSSCMSMPVEETAVYSYPTPTPKLTDINQDLPITKTQVSSDSCISPLRVITEFQAPNSEVIDLAQLYASMDIVSEPALSKNRQILALALYETNKDQRSSHLTLFNIKQETFTWLLDYQAVDYFTVEIAWSPDNNWVAFLPHNIAYGDDGGLWVFNANTQESFHLLRATSIDGWNTESQKLYYYFKDGYGFIDITTWEVAFDEKCRE